MTVIEFAEKRLEEEIRENERGADNNSLVRFWNAYLQGARAQKEEDERA